MIITLCGSTRFKDEFLEVQKELTLDGHIVISVGCFGHADPDPRIKASEEMLDAMHLKKIDMADAIYVVNVGDYIGSSTKREIAYAREHGKPVFFHEEPDLAKVVEV
jgi:hypothetical protein